MLTLQCPGFSCQSESLSHPHCLTLPRTLRLMRAHPCTQTHRNTLPWRNRRHKHASPRYRDVYVCVYIHTSLTQSETRGHLLKGVFDGGHISHYARTHAQLDCTPKHAPVRTNKQTRLEDDKKSSELQDLT